MKLGLPFRPATQNASKACEIWDQGDELASAKTGDGDVYKVNKLRPY